MGIWPGILALLTWVGVGTAQAASCQTTVFEDAPITWCEINPSQETLRLWRADSDGKAYGSFNRLNGALSKQGLALGVAMNGGMYHDDRAPVGLYIEDGAQQKRVITSKGPGNFGLLPNGVLCIKGTRVQVIESLAYAKTNSSCTFATQSGPMLVIDGALHPRFLPASKSLNIRNGVGVRADGMVVLAISDAPVNFHHFARFFRDQVKTPNALFLDGTVSKLYAPMLDRDDIGLPMGPILGTVQPDG